MLPEGDIDDLKRDPPRMPSCPGKSGQAGRETSRDRRRVAENLGNEGILKERESQGKLQESKGRPDRV